MKNSRLLLMHEITDSYVQGDTTVLAEILEGLSDSVVFGSLSDEGQSKTPNHELLIQDHITRFGYGIAKERYGLNTLKEYGLLSDLDKARENAQVAPKTIHDLNDLNDLNDLVLPMIAEMVQYEIIKDCTDTDESTEFDVQDIIVNKLAERFGIKQD